MSIPQLTALPVPATKETEGLLNVCLISTEIIGPFRNGGVATANTGLAQFLRSLGHSVTVLYCNTWQNKPYVSDLDFEHWVEYYQKQGISLIALHMPDQVKTTSLHRARSFAVNSFLEDHPFNLAFTDDLYGLCFYSLQAKRAGIAFSNTTFILTVHSPHIWLATLNKTPYRDLEYLLLVDQEIYCIENADYVIGPSEYLLNWLQNLRVRLPERTFVQQYVLPRETESRLAGSQDRRKGAKNASVAEIVFFGRLETRKGLILFCDMVDRLSKHCPDVKITFLGKYDTVLGEHAGSYIVRRALKWPNQVRILTDYNTQEALSYLLSGKRLAVMASLEDNSPCTVMECILNGVAFVTTGTGGIYELIAPEDRETCVAGVSAERLAELCVQAIQSGIKPPQFAFQQETIRKRLGGFITVLSSELPSRRDVSGPAPELLNVRADDAPGLPLVSVCVTHYNQGLFLPEQLEAIANQSYRNLEVTVVDDGSTNEFSQGIFRKMAERYSPLGWKFIRQANAYLGAARNRATREATGKYLLFMDDDNVALPDQVQTFVSAAEHSGADIISCFSYMTFDIASPTVEQSFIDYYPMGGASRAGGLVTNVFADANSLFRRESFQALGGFSETRGFACQDWQIFAEAKLAGMTHLVIPRPLYFYRRRWDGMFMRSSDTESNREIFKVYADQTVGSVAGAIELLLGIKKDSANFVLREYLDTLEHGEKLVELSDLPFGSRNSQEAHRLIFEYLALNNRLADAMQYASDHQIEQGYAISAIRKKASDVYLENGLADILKRTEEPDSRSEFIQIPDHVLQSAIRDINSVKGYDIVQRVEQGILVRPITGYVNRVLLPRACPTGVKDLIIEAEIRHEASSSVEVGVLLLDPDLRDLAFHNDLFSKALNLGQWSGWLKVETPFDKTSIQISNNSYDRPKDMILAVRTSNGSVTDYAHLVFSKLRVVKNGLNLEDELRANLGPARQTLRLPRQVLERCEHLQHGNENFTQLTIDGKGLHLHPSENGWNLAVCRQAIPSAATRVSATVTLEHDSANPVDFALWVGKLEEVELYSEPYLEWVHGAQGWSGWKRVDEGLNPLRIEADLIGQPNTYTSLDIFIATRIMPGTSHAYCKAYFRNFEVEIKGL